MDDLTLNSGEVILHRTQTLIICGVRYEAVFTTTRLILVASGTGTIYDDIPLADIHLAVSGVNKLREPVITLTIGSPGGENRNIDLIFIRQAGDLSNADLGKCITVLREQKVPVEIRSQSAGPEFSSSGQRILPGELIGEEPFLRPAVPDWTVFGTSRKEKKPLPSEAPKQAPIVLIAGALFIVIILLIGMVVTVQLISGKNTAVNQSVNGSNVTGKVASSAAPTPIPGLQVTTPPVPSTPTLTVPKNGVWIGISYPGNFSGYIGGQGRQIEVNSSGDVFYKIPVSDAMIEGQIGKGDGSPEKIEVGIYNGGTLVSKSETRKPWGVVDIHVMVGPALGNPVVTETPVLQPTISPYASLPPASVPTTGVWVRVYYPGNYTGSIRSTGLTTEVNSTGDRFYPVPITSGMIDGSIEKQDGSADTLIVEVYRGGSLISRGYTITPRGVLNINAVV